MFFFLIDKFFLKRYYNISVQLNGRLWDSASRQRLQYPVGVSLGYAISGETASENLETLIEQADRKMYESKKKRAGARKK